MPLLFSLVFNALSAWWLIVCFAIGLMYAFVLYSKTSIENPLLKKILFTFRFICVGILVLLLLSPLFKTISKRLEKPLVIIAQDASQSIFTFPNNGFDTTIYHQNLKKLAEDLANDYEVKTLNFGSEVKIDFDFSQKAKQSDISAIFNYVNQQYPNRNIGALVLSSDGIYNKGANPINQVADTKFPVYTIALGDTIPKKDLVLLAPNYNQLVYLGNNHQIEIPINAYKAKGLSTVLNITTNDEQRKQQNISFVNDEESKTIQIDLAALKKGIQKITIQLVPLAGELSVNNNVQTIFVEVLDGREKILIVANAPHPDITAIKQAIKSKENYEVQLAFANDLSNISKDNDLIIFHDLPSKEHPITNFINQTKQNNRWFIIGANTQTKTLNSCQNLLNINASNQVQTYSAKLSTDFYAFSLSEETKTFLQNLAPLNAPYGNYTLKSNAQTLFNQQVGIVVSTAPLLVFGTEQQAKIAVLTGEGIWRWRIENFEKNENFEAFDEVISKSVQYLSAKNDKRKFRVNAQKNRFSENEVIILNAELYNDSYELVNTPDVSIDLKSKTGKKYSYLFSKNGNSYQLNAGILPPDEYSFTAKTSLGKQNYSANGNFLVEEVNVELTISTANHQLLFNLANSTDGEMVYPDNLLALEDLIKKNDKVKTVSFTENLYEPLINIWWIFGLIILLLSFEWFLRKRNGAI
ncbi:hypothetical protein [Pedobacter alpinus]|uniref:VWA domain-containing protein n=1 Tax=Pedobacter alpinus TaxID=1590643 RepID=A0ABW5TTX2_9SPHI